MNHTRYDKENFTPICEHKEIKIEKEFIESAWFVFFGVVTIGIAIGHLFYLWGSL